MLQRPVESSLNKYLLINQMCKQGNEVAPTWTPTLCSPVLFSPNGIKHLESNPNCDIPFLEIR